MILAEVSEATRISVSTLQCLEADDAIAAFKESRFNNRLIRENIDIPQNDELLVFLQLLVVDENEYRRCRICERFNMVMKSLFEKHKADKLSPEQADVAAEMKEEVEAFLGTQKTKTANKAKAIVMCKQLGLNTSKADQ